MCVLSTGHCSLKKKDIVRRFVFFSLNSLERTKFKYVMIIQNWKRCNVKICFYLLDVSLCWRKNLLKSTVLSPLLSLPSEWKTPAAGAVFDLSFWRFWGKDFLWNRYERERIWSDMRVVEQVRFLKLFCSMNVFITILIRSSRSKTRSRSWRRKFEDCLHDAEENIGRDRVVECRIERSKCSTCSGWCLRNQP